MFVYLFCLLPFVSPFFISGLQLSYLSYFISDSMSIWIIYTLFFVLFFTYVSFTVDTNQAYNSVLLYILLFVLLFFTSSNVLTVYLMFEASLLPIVYVILKWGSYPERSKSVTYILLFTIIFSFPFLLFFLSYVNWLYTLSFSVFSFGSYLPIWVALFLFFTFLVNLPVYFLHYWLPIAHVEAPTFGSMFLAGVLLNLGGYGLWRFSTFLNQSSLSDLFIVPFLVGGVLAAFSAFSQHDFNRLVAYSSVVHMTCLSWLALFSSSTSTDCIYVAIIVYHGVTSPLMFYLVGLVYYFDNSRLLYSIGSVKNISFLFTLIFTLSLISAIPTPPLATFALEIYLFTTLASSSFILFIVVLLFTFISLLYNLIWFLPLAVFKSSSSHYQVLTLDKLLVPTLITILFFILNLYLTIM